MSLFLVLFHVQDGAGSPIGGATAQASSPNGDWLSLTNQCGDVVDPGTGLAGVLLAAGDYTLTFGASGYVSRTIPVHIATEGPPIRVGLERGVPVWPSGLHQWKGAFCIPDAMPGQPAGFGDGVRIWTPAYGAYPDVWRREMLNRYLQRGYTHFVYNIASPDGVYHNDYPALPDDLARARRDLTEILAAGLIPVVACCNDANGGTTTPYASVKACQDLIPIAFPMWEQNGPLGVDTMVNGVSVGRNADAILNTRAALLPETLLYVHFTAGHGAGAEPEGDWWQWFARAANGQGLLSQDDHWDDPVITASGLADTANHLHGHVAGWGGLNLDNVAFELQTTALYHNGRTEAQGLAFMAQVLPNAGAIAGFCDSGKA